MRNRFRWLIYISTCFLLFSMELSAQQSLVYNCSEEAWREGMALFQKGNYGAAQNVFADVMTLESSRFSDRYTRAQFYSAWCAIELFRPDAEEQMKAFVREHPESSLLQEAYFQLGRHQYRNKKYRAALVWFKQVDPYQLRGDREVEYRFKTGYCQFVNEDYDKAAQEFYEIKDVSGDYHGPANYYYAHIAYLNKNYQTALNGFEKLGDNETFAPIVPYYICQIYYLQGKYQMVVDYAPPYLEEASTRRVPEIARIIGQSYYRMQQYEKAVPFLERYRKEGPGLQREEQFELGYCYYKLRDYRKASELLEQLGGKEDAMLQTSSYCLAECYLKLDDKQRAKAAFATTARMDFDKDMQQDALFNYAKITYELSYSPFNETIKAFDEYLQKYPDSDRNDEAYDYLVKVYMTTRNYKDALVSMDRIKRKTPAIREAYQRVSYLRGLELFKQLTFEEAIQNFDASLLYREYNRRITAECLYWKAEANYRMGNYPDAIKGYNEFMLTPGASLSDLYDRAYYNLGYACFKQKEYKEASVWFRKFENRLNGKESVMLTDARNRIGDYYFLNREYALAVKYYDLAADPANWDTDYALYQKGFAQGLMGKPVEKVETMKRLLNTYPQSAYADDALYEQGRAWVMADQEAKAIACYRELAQKYPESSYIGKAYLQLGLLNYSAKAFEAALTAYKEVVDRYPGTPDARSAMIGIKNVYVDLNRVDDYFAYVRSLGQEGEVKVTEMDSLTYISAERTYMAGKLEEASHAFERYQKSFPNGQFLLNANFYKAECDVQKGEVESSLQGYEYVLEQPHNLFTEQSLVAASQLNFRKEDYQKAGEQFHRLEESAEIPANVLLGQIGRMRCSYFLNRYAECAEVAGKVMNSEKVAEEIVREARFDKAKSQLALGNKAEALKEFRILARETQSAEGAESKFRLAKILFDQNQVQETENEINSFIEMNSPHQYWLAESFILLADVFLKKDDAFQARYTLQSIVDNYGETSDGIIDRAQAKLNQLLEAEKAEAEKKKAKEIQFQFEQKGKKDYQKLFENEQPVKDTLGLDEAKMMLDEMLKNEKDSVY